MTIETATQPREGTMITTSTSKDIWFLHNGGFDGEVIACIPTEVAQVELGNGHVRIRIPFEDLKVLVAQHVRSRMVAVLEDAGPNEILGLE